MPGRARYVIQVVVAAASSAASTPPAASQQLAPAAPGSIVRLDRRLDRLVSSGARLERVVDGFDWLEGPVWQSAGGYLLFSDIPRNAVFRWQPGAAARLFLARSGYTGSARFAGREPGSNGLTLDREGRLVLCEHGDRRITRLERDGRKTVLVDRYQGRRLNSPNDLVFRSSGDLYFTDPPFGLPGAFDDPARELAWSGVYRVTPDGVVTLLTTTVRAPNGIAFSADERTLYVSNADRSDATYLAFRVRDDGTLDDGRVLFDVTPWTSVYPGGPDGMKVDRDGNIFAVGPGGVYVLAPDGTHLGSLVTGVSTSNVAWGGDGSDLYITAGGTIYRIRLATRGADRGVANGVQP